MIIFNILVAVLVVIIAYELIKGLEPEITVEKLVAVVVCAIWFILACLFEPAGAMVGLFLFVPLGLIWFGDELGSLTGLHYGIIDQESPGFLIRLFGWILLMAPLGVGIFQWITAGGF
ncbi:MAG: hypothetical protein JW719_09780 [Pirellulales bacterium]|nr:hypothetical protein [Pirellulales bacterium]